MRLSLNKNNGHFKGVSLLRRDLEENANATLVSMFTLVTVVNFVAVLRGELFASQTTLTSRTPLARAEFWLTCQLKDRIHSFFL